MSLTAIVFLPLAGAIALLIMSSGRASDESEAQIGWIRAAAFAVTLLTFVLSIPLLLGFDATSAEMQFQQTSEWIPSLGIEFGLGVDGISLTLVLLTTFMMPLAVLGAWNYVSKGRREFYIAMLILETGMLGVFTATDLFLFYVFWEAALIPMYLIIGIWGGMQRRYATTKFVIYTMAGSLLMFIGILYIHIAASKGAGGDTFAIDRILEVLNPDGRESPLSLAEQWWLFAAFGLAFAIKVPVWPLHTWLPDAHVEAPTPGSVILAAVLLKMGGYGFLRFAMPLFPDAAVTFAPLMCTLAIIGIIYGALMALAQSDMKKLIAYSSVSHLGYCMLGFFVLNTTGMTGGLYQMLNHGISSGALFMMAGMLYERRHTREIEQFGGLAKSMPMFTTVFIIVTLSSIGLPLTNGFVGEFTILAGAFMHSWVYALLAGLGVILGAAYMLYMVMRVFFGPIHLDVNGKLSDMSGRELAVMLPMVAMIFIMGIFPSVFTDSMRPSIKRLEAQLSPAVERQAERGRSRLAPRVADNQESRP